MVDKVDVALAEVAEAIHWLKTKDFFFLPRLICQLHWFSNISEKKEDPSPYITEYL